MRRLFGRRQQEQAIQERLFLRASAAFERRLSRELAAGYRDAASLLIQDGEFAIDAAIAAHSERMATMYASAYRGTAETFARRIRDGMKSYYPRYRKDFGVTFDDKLSDFTRTYVADRVTKVNATTKNQIRGIVRRTLEDGDTLEDAAAQIRRQAGPMSRTRAHIIARTETHTAGNAGLQFEAEASEFDMVKEWISAADDRTRDDEFDHVDVDGQQVGEKERFTVSGEDLLFPGDPMGSAGNIINCRCATGWAIV
jgi:hypothetical protein